MVVLNLISILIVGAWVNEKWSNNLARRDARLANRLGLSQSLQPGVPNNLPSKQSAFSQIDEKEEEILTSIQITEFETITIPLVGLKIPASDASFFAALAMLVSYAWLWISMKRNQSVLAQILYPICANRKDPQAAALWADETGNGGAIDSAIDEYRADAYRVREILAPNFLLIYSRTKSRRLLQILGVTLICLPASLAIAHTTADVYWDFWKKWPAASSQTFYSELGTHATSSRARARMEKDVRLQRQYDNFASVLEGRQSMLLGKRIVSGAVVFFLLLLIAGIVHHLWRSSRVLTTMYRAPASLRSTILEWLDVEPRSELR